MGSGNSVFRRHLLQATFLSTTLMTGGVPYARAQSCTPGSCIVNPGQVAISGSAGAATGGGGVAVSLTSTGTSGNIALSGTSTGGTGANGSDGVWYAEPWKDNISATGGQSGGSGGGVAITNSGAIAAPPAGSAYHGIFAGALGAQGGVGGNGAVDVSGASGGAGGAGGTITISNAASGAIAIVNPSATAGLFGIYATANGGSGNKGGGNGSLSVSGKSGNGGAAGTVYVGNLASITTSGFNTTAIQAVGVGGMGGNGVGYANTAFKTGYAGNGGTGAGFAQIGAAGLQPGQAITIAEAGVAVVNSGALTTSGTSAAGIFADASGGNGGNVGWNSISTGGNAGNAGTVFVSNTGTISVTGTNASGIAGIAAGGTGGQGGYHSYFGAMGGNGGDGGFVTIVSSGAVQTGGGGIADIYASANGGRGGKAGFGDGETYAGGAGGNAGTVHLTHTGGTLQTAGAGSPDIMALAVGGAGGPITTPTFPYDAAGLSGGTGGSVSVQAVLAPPNGQPNTSGANSPAVLLDASGGAGGNGKNGGAGGNAGTATLALSGAILVTGDQSGGAVVLTQGGSGGTAGIDSSGNQGAGGWGGNGGAASVTSSAAITVQGAGAAGIYVNSSGGAGGVSSPLTDPGSLGGGSAGSAYLRSTGAIQNQSAAYGAGIVVLALGGSACQEGFTACTPTVQTDTCQDAPRCGPGPGGAGGAATVKVYDSVVTRGTTAPASTSLPFISPAIAVMTRGGNGGYGTYYGKGAIGSGGAGGAIALTLGQTGAPAMTLSTLGASSPVVYLNAGGGYGGNGAVVDGQVLASGGNGGNAGAITLALASNVAVSSAGAASAGIVARSIGGYGGSVVNPTFDSTIGTGGNGGNGGKITIQSYGAITTSGDNAPGILAVSAGGFAGVGGGCNACAGGSGVGGAGGNSLYFTPSGIAGNIVTVVNSGKISTYGAGSSGIVVQALGGNGGDGLGAPNGAGGASGNISVGNYGAIVTRGDSSHGIMAYSIGGGGGTGSSFSSGLDIFARGGVGGAGGAAGPSTLTNSGVIKTYGAASNGLFAFSIGGGGGAGDSVGAMGLGAFNFPSVSIALGGAGGDGAKGGDITLNNNTGGDITTAGTDAAAIRALSLGGTGGAGGASNSTSYSLGFGQKDAFNLTVSIAGTGGSGGNGGTIALNNAGNIVTYGGQSDGLLALSIGGGGGDGGNALSHTYAYGISTNIDFTVTMGGSGGAGGTGGDITVNNTTVGTSIATSGFAADAIAAYSLGGGGGLGGTGVSHLDTKVPVPGLGYLPLAFSESYGLALTLGGNGGAGGSGGVVSVTNDAALSTTGVDARGIFAQSVGGGGGNAAAGKTTATQENTFDITIGGSGGAAGDGGKVTVTNSSTGQITTEGDGAHGIFAQSVGGGGGNAGASSADTGSDTLSQIEENASRAVLTVLLDAIKNMPQGVFEKDFLPTAQLSLSVGGNGGAGGHGGNIYAYNYGKIVTSGDLAIGVLAQSVGGGGGSGGAATVDGTRLVEANLAVGGNGGAAGYGGTVTVASSGSIQTAGDSAFGVLAQSIGGGGGMGGIGVGLSQIALGPTATLGGAIATNSVSTGGYTSVTVANVTTAGNEAHGVVAQSIGGGGGLFYLNQQDQASATGDAQYQAEILAALLANPNIGQDAVNQMAAAFAAAVASSSGQLTLDLGGSQQDQNPGQATGNGGTAKVTTTGTITTTGANAFGILAQSIGGGGGFATDGSGVSLSSFTVTGRLGNTSTGSAQQAGGSAVVVLGSGSAILTQGDGASAILAQSIGGGGGYTGAIDGTGASYATFLPPQTGAVMTVGSSTEGGAVSISTGGAATIETSGANAHGIVAQSLSGGGGLVGNGAGLIIPTNAGNGSRNLQLNGFDFAPGAITITYTGTIRTGGADSIAIFAQSGTQGTSGAIDRTTPMVTSGAITVSIGDDSLVSGGSGAGAAIVLDGGGTNTITVGDNSTVSALSGLAISSAWGNNVLINNGTITGDVILASAGTPAGNQGTFTNGIGATFVSLPSGTVDLGSGTMTNSGVVNVGGTNVIGQLTLVGTFTQNGGGSMVLDVQGANPSLGVAAANDQLFVTSVGTVLGVVNVNVMNSINPTDSFTLLTQSSAANPMGGATRGLTFSTVENGGPSLTWTATTTDTTLTITPNADFTPVGARLDANQRAYAQHLQATWDAGGSDPLGPVYAELVHLPSLGAYEQALSTAMPSAHAMGPLAAALISREALGSVLSCPQFQASGTLLVQGDCAWARVDGSRTSFTPGDYTGFTFNAMTYRMGAQKEVAPGWFVGLGANYTNGWAEGEFGTSSTEGQDGGVTAALKREIGPWLLSGAVHLGYGRFTADRQTVVGASTYLSDAAYDVFTAAGRLRAEYQMPFETWYLKPFGQVDLIYTNVPGFNEGGHLSPYDLAVAQSDNLTVALGPHLEVGARYDLPDGSTLRPYGTVGATWFSNNAWEVVSALRGAPAGAGTFTSTVPLPDLLADVGVGLQWSTAAGFDLRLSYDAQLGSDFLSQSGMLRFSARF